MEESEREVKKKINTFLNKNQKLFLYVYKRLTAVIDRDLCVFTIIKIIANFLKMFQRFFAPYLFF